MARQARTSVDLLAAQLDVGGESSDDNETKTEPPQFRRPRRGGVAGEQYKKGYYREPKWNKSGSWEHKLFIAVQSCATFKTFSDDDHKSFVEAMEIHKRFEGQPFYEQGDAGDSLFVILEGRAECQRGGHTISVKMPGSVIDEAQILYSLPRSHSLVATEVCVAGKFRREDYVDLSVRHEFSRRSTRQFYLRNSKLLEMMEDEQIASITDCLQVRTYEAGSNIITQDTEGKEFFVLEKGEARVWKKVKDDEQTYVHYYGGELFGELGLVRNVPRAANVTAVNTCTVLVFTRKQFERLFGPISQLHAQQYLTDPRKLIADFYGPSDGRGPAGSLRLANTDIDTKKYGESKWFVVYRPTSRDAIQRMLSGNAVGKGLNVKGKSAKKGILSGLVPFVQISDNKHKDMIEQSPPNARLCLYFKTKASREEARKILNTTMAEPGSKLDIAERRITLLEDYEPNAFGLDLPEALLREQYIMRPDLSPIMGWETGRKSEPAYMDMNLHAIRDVSEPKVVLYQNDDGEPMNPRGLLIAYAEKYVKPVVSDFDTFTVGSIGMSYDPLPVDQCKLVAFNLDQTEKILSTLDHNPWTSRWLNVMKQEDYHPKLPKFGFGDPTSYRLIGDVVAETSPCGAVRHGAECCNFSFPQELDDEFLVVWHGFPEKPWDYRTEETLRQFLLERIAEGYAFPINPVWTIRDKGWWEVMAAMKQSKSAKAAMSSWYPSEARILERVEKIRKAHPEGFRIVDEIKK
uniref:Cyclic nucleotide-binding domain-containing protein n=1 Tax=Alexandrium monilatum TaxID=311494 RepID=A0A7S4Q425_9DINO|mmetsp:Transcript_17663/g.55369  ORF Transcript_17663/g.55369 Transcript_17663/m.55369 type:complete len:745 (+) Transcript_17663:62-2296(+)